MNNKTPTMREALQEIIRSADLLAERMHPIPSGIEEGRAALANDSTPELLAAVEAIINDLPYWYQTRRPEEYKRVMTALKKANDTK